jgi:hypothetical protein
LFLDYIYARSFLNQSLKQKLTLLSGILGFIVPMVFAYTIMAQKIPQNIASWGMVLVLDLLGVALAIKAGNKKPYMQIGWAIAAVFIVAAILFTNHSWQFGIVEGASLLFASIAVYMWLFGSPRIGLYAYIAAMYISFAPVMVDYWTNPVLETIWVWEWSALTCMIALFGAEKKDFSSLFVPWAAMVLNLIITWLCLR